jgi:hypothetical protein
MMTLPALKESQGRRIMPFTADYNHDEKLIRIEFSPPDVLQQHIDAKQSITRLAKENNCLDVVVDMSQMNTASTLSREDQFSFTESWKEGNYAGFQFAIILPREEEYRDVWYFMVQVITSMGIVGKAFSSHDEAINWLRPRASV